jgi:putative membrane protein
MNARIGLMIAAAVAIPQLASAASLSEKDSKYMTESAQGLMSEVKLGEMAQQRGQDERVKAFGKQMVDDHGKDLQNLKQLATQKNVTLPATLNKDQSKEAQKLAKLSGKDFDKEYLKYEAKDHSHDVKENGEQMKKAADPDVKKFASAEYETVTKHKKAVDELRTQIK